MARRRPRVGSRFIIQGEGVGPAIKRIQDQVDTAVYGSRLTVADEVVKALRNPSRSLVNVDTGTMRANYWAKAHKNQNRITLGNRAKSASNSARYPGGYHYPQKYKRGVVKTLRVNRPGIVRRSQRRIERNPRGPRDSARLVY